MVTRKIERAREGQSLGVEAAVSPAGQPALSFGGKAAEAFDGKAAMAFDGKAAVAPGKHPPVSFEQAIARLGEIVESLEEGEQPLEESLALFEEGMSLAKSSQEILDRAERRIEELLGVDAQGRAVVRELDPD